MAILTVALTACTSEFDPGANLWPCTSDEECVERCDQTLGLCVVGEPWEGDAEDEADASADEGSSDTDVNVDIELSETVPDAPDADASDPSSDAGVVDADIVGRSLDADVYVDIELSETVPDALDADASDSEPEAEASSDAGVEVDTGPAPCTEEAVVVGEAGDVLTRLWPAEDDWLVTGWTGGQGLALRLGVDGSEEWRGTYQYAETGVVEATETRALAAAEVDGVVFLAGRALLPEEDAGLAWAARLSESGKIVWQRVLGGPYEDVATAIIKAPPKPGLYVLGTRRVVNSGEGAPLIEGFWRWQLNYAGDDQPPELNVSKLSVGATLAGVSSLPDGLAFFGQRDTINAGLQGMIVVGSENLACTAQKVFSNQALGEVDAISGLVPWVDGLMALGRLEDGRCWLARLNHLGEPRWERVFGALGGECRVLAAQESGVVVGGVDDAGAGVLYGLDAAGRVAWQEALAAPIADLAATDGGLLVLTEDRTLRWLSHWGAWCLDDPACPTAQDGCDDADPCTVDRCQAEVGCAHEAADEGAPCEDGDACSVADQCVAGACEAGSPLACTLTCVEASGCPDPWPECAE